MDEFAAEFGHEVNRLFPIHLFFMDGELVAYLHMRRQVCCYPAFHPKMSPRQWYTLAGSMSANAKALYGDPLIVRPKDQEQFSDRIMEKLHMRQAPFNFYEVIS